MSREAAFLQAMIEDPQTALIFADYLEESGDPRGELLRLVCTLTRSVKVPKRAEREKRLRALLAEGVRPVGPFWTNAVGMRFAWVPPGAFLMGSPAKEKWRGEDEVRHKVTLTRGFWMGVHLVTQAQWQAVMGDNPSSAEGDDLPVEKVYWDDCQEFCKSLGGKDGKPYRLPTEAEWEYACRAGTTTPFHFGATLSTDQANYDGKWTYGKGVKGVYRGEMTPVGIFPGNAWGLHDMHGNAQQWCSDWYGPYPEGDAVDPHVADRGKGRDRRKDHVIRGASYASSPAPGRSACRFHLAPTMASYYLSLRVCFHPTTDAAL